jgi:hypothetical protein
MGKRVDLQALLERIPGPTAVFFQAPQNVALEYPVILYSRDYAVTKFANNLPYRFTKRYQVIVIDRNPDSEIPDKVAALPLCTFNRHYVADELHHDVYNLYF